MQVSFDGEVIEWRGPAPYLFVPVAGSAADTMTDWAKFSYGWGCIPVLARIGETEWTTSLIPRHGQYLVPIRVGIQRAEDVGVGDLVHVELSLRLDQ